MASEDYQANREARGRRQENRIQNDSRLPRPDVGITFEAYYIGRGQDGRMRSYRVAEEDYPKINELGLRRSLHLYPCNWEADECGFIRPRDWESIADSDLYGHKERTLAGTIAYFVGGVAIGMILMILLLNALP